MQDRTMTRPRAWTTLGVALALPLAACGGGEGGHKLPLEDFPIAFAQAMERKQSECCADAGTMGSTVSAAALAGAWTETIAEWQASIDAQRLVYHADDAFEIVSEVEDMTCGDFSLLGESHRFFASLLGPFEGLVADGAACAGPADCISRYCEHPSLQGGSAGTSLNMCKPKPGAGAPCPQFECADGFYCAQTPSAPESGICKPLRADGVSCLRGEECANGGCNGSDPATQTPGSCGAPELCPARTAEGD